MLKIADFSRFNKIDTLIYKNICKIINFQLFRDNKMKIKVFIKTNNKFLHSTEKHKYINSNRFRNNYKKLSIVMQIKC